jgi:hypothetical protein
MMASKQGVVVWEEEYIGEIYGTTGFGTTAYAFNPGQSGTFPWLSKQAAQWEKYAVTMAEFFYKPEVSAYATNGQSGKVILSFDYDASDAPPTTKQQAEDTHPHATCMPYAECTLKLDPKQLNGQDSKYVRLGGLPGSSDIKTYDGGNLNVTTSGNTNTNVMGELWIRYAIRLLVPVLESTASAPANNSVSTFESTTAESLTTATFLTLALATSQTNGVMAVNTTGTVVPKPGNYLVDVAGSFIGAGGYTPTNLTYLVLNKNGATVWTSFEPQGDPSTITALTLNGSAFVSCNGTDNLTLTAKGSFSAGTYTCSGYMRLVAM